MSEKPSVTIDAVCVFDGLITLWWFEAETEVEIEEDDGMEPMVISTNGMYDSRNEALAAAHEWAVAHRYTVREDGP